LEVSRLFCVHLATTNVSIQLLLAFLPFACVNQPFLTEKQTNFFSRNDLVKKYIGESRVSEALGLGSSGKRCSDYYSKDVCPWDTSAMIKIVSKLLNSGWRQ
jgi:hypothetical protein